MLTGLDVVDIPVNNAGGSRSFKELHVPEAAWQEAITLNFHRARQHGDALIDGVVVQRWSRVVNITGKSEPERVNGAFCAQAALHGCAKGLSRMGAARRHGALHSPGRIHSEQSCATTRPAIAGGRSGTRSRRAATASRSTSRTWCVSWSARWPAASPAP